MKGLIAKTQYMKNYGEVLCSLGFHGFANGPCSKADAVMQRKMYKKIIKGKLK